MNRKLRTGRVISPSSISQTPLRVSPVTTRRLRVEHPGVPEVGDQQATPHRRHQRGGVRVGRRPVDRGRPVRRRSSGTQPQVGRHRRPNARHPASACPVDVGAGLGRGPPVVGDRPGDAGVDQGQRAAWACPRRRTAAPTPGRRGVVDDRDRRVELRRARARRRTAARCTALPLKPYSARFCSRSATAVGSSTTSYRPGGSSTGSAPARALAAARAAEHGAVEVGQPARAPAGPPRRRPAAGRCRPSPPRPPGRRRACPARVGERAGPVDRCGSSRPSPGRRRRRRTRAPGRPARSAVAVRGRLVARCRSGDQRRRRRQARPARVGRAQREPRPGCARPAPRSPSSVDHGGASRRRSARRGAAAAGRVVVASATFWWMHGVGEPGQRQRRVGRPAPRPARRGRPAARTRSTTRPAMIELRLGSCPHPHPDAGEPGRRGRDGRCGRSGRAGPCRSSACPRRRSRDESMSIERQNVGPIPV